jgi:hypothetical protein
MDHVMPETPQQITEVNISHDPIGRRKIQIQLYNKYCLFEHDACSELYFLAFDA